MQGVYFQLMIELFFDSLYHVWKEDKRIKKNYAAEPARSSFFHPMYSPSWEWHNWVDRVPGQQTGKPALATFAIVCNTSLYSIVCIQTPNQHVHGQKLGSKVYRTDVTAHKKDRPTGLMRSVGLFESEILLRGVFWLKVLTGNFREQMPQSDITLLSCCCWKSVE